MIHKAPCVAFAAVILFSPLLSQEKNEKDKKIPPLQHHVVVTATRIETPAHQVASSVSVIVKEDLDRMKMATVLKTLGEIPGLTVIQNGTLGGAASILIRGANSEHTLVLMDGVELNDPITPARSVDLAHFTLENIERIEILRGPQSTLYGSDALSGVVNIITQKGQGKPKFSLSSTAGSYGTFFSSAGLSGGTDKIHYSLGTTYIQSNGFSAASTDYEGNKEKDGYRNLSFSGRFGYRFTKNLELDLILRTLDARIEVDNFGGPFGDDPNFLQKNKAYFLKGEIRALLMNNRWEQKLGFSLVDNDRRHENPPDTSHPIDSEEGLFKSKLFKLYWQSNFFLRESNTLTFGIDHQQEQGESEYYSDGIWGPSSILFPLEQTRTTGFYVQDQIRIDSRFFAAAGIRWDMHTQFGTSTTYRIAPAYFIKTAQTKLKATLGTGFKSPSLYQLYAPPTSLGPVGNEDLRPEQSTAWDIGIEHYLIRGKLLLSVTYFKSDYKNLIQFDFAHGYTNIGRAESKGLELLFQARPHEGVVLNASYTRTETMDLDTDTPLLRRPKDKFSASLHYPFLKKANISLSLIYIGKSEDMDFSIWPAERVTLSEYTLLNSVLSYDMTPHAQAFLRLDNILNEGYEMIKGYGAPGFSVFGGINLHF
ncbi:MAG: TonB-dependent receptor [Candidatus Aminicenantes bacterium]|jgi:vitamin B12 transporter